MITFEALTTCEWCGKTERHHQVRGSRAEWQPPSPWAKTETELGVLLTCSGQCSLAACTAAEEEMARAKAAFRIRRPGQVQP